VQASKTFLLALYCLVAIGLTVYVHTVMWPVDTRGRDVYYSWLEGRRILAGVNPYARILPGDMVENDKYATYFPLFYLLSSLTQAAGLRSYDEWIGFWRYPFLIAHIGIGAIIFLVFYRQKQVLAAVTTSLLWLLNNWAIIVTYIAHFDAIPLFFLLLSLTLFDKRLYLSLLCFSLSLALKQIAIFLVPLYLIWLWQSGMGIGDRGSGIGGQGSGVGDGGLGAGGGSVWQVQPRFGQDRLMSSPVKRVVIGGLVMASLPLLFSLPFIVWQPEGFFRSIIFSLTRGAANPYAAGAQIIGRSGLLSRLPMFLGLGLVFILAWQNKVGRYMSAMLVMLAFTALTTVLFPQYLIWLIALVILSLHDALIVLSFRQQTAS
jgi:uncharacterized membrane protein